eukprot:m.56847 g.56847  ORF g.56847 m.56847 type:complete len:101 (+) comp12065_c0_seq1:160-462(+)
MFHSLLQHYPWRKKLNSEPSAKPPSAPSLASTSTVADPTHHTPTAATSPHEPQSAHEPCVTGESSPDSSGNENQSTLSGVRDQLAACLLTDEQLATAAAQ